MTGLDIFALFVIAVLVAVVILIAVKLGALPGKLAAKREHPQADAIRVCGWIGVLTLGVAWPIALVWAYSRPRPRREHELFGRLEALEREVSTLTEARV